ncbi:MAG: prolyl oligopeptidase family serine peptidase [Pseudomonadales bacterium]|nr:prolyl oligopeptidase family serine peptidase [Pseudomonadales bacterium]
MTGIEYPAARTVDATDGQAGVEFPDPYQWLEDDSDEVRAWQRAQAALASSQVKAWPHYETLKSRVDHYLLKRFASVPRQGGDKWFWGEYVDGQSQASLMMGDQPFQSTRCLFDPAEFDPDNLPFLSWVVPSPDGSVVAIGLCTDGSEANTIHLIDVTSGKTLDNPPSQVLPDAWMGGISWLPDSSGFYFQAFTKDVASNEKAVYLHDMDSGQQQPQDINDVMPGDWVHISISDDDRLAIAHASLMTPSPVAIKTLPDGEWEPFITDVQASITGYVLGNDYVALTDLDANRGRVVSIPLDSPTPNDPATWTTVIPESEVAMRTLIPAGGHLYVSGYENTYTTVNIYNREGEPGGSVLLSDRGAIMEMPFPLMNIAPHGDSYVFTFSSLTRSPGTYRHTPGADTLEELKAPDRILKGAVVEDFEAISEDGTAIPYHVVRLADVESGPSLLYGYGGFNAPWPPVFPAQMATIIEAGGLFVHMHLRGGAEFGRSWWEGGRLKNKTNCYKDLYAVAEDLAERGLSSHDRMALTGGSNGGMLCGMAITERPDLWSAVVPVVPFLDLFGALRTPYGYTGCMMEFGDPRDANEVRRMAQFSPYNRIEPGHDFPAVFIDAGDTDPRCPPFHARKFAARLQAANPDGQPVLMHVWENVGHGWATDDVITLEEKTEGLAFIMQHTGLTPLETTS